MQPQTALVIKLCRVARRWRQQDLADALGVSRARVAQIEGGWANPGTAVLLRFAEVLDSDDLRAMAKAARR